MSMTIVDKETVAARVTLELLRQGFRTRYCKNPDMTSLENERGNSVSISFIDDVVTIYVYRQTASAMKPIVIADPNGITPRAVADRIVDALKPKKK